MESCSRSFPIRNYTVLVRDSTGDFIGDPILLATPAASIFNLSASNFPSLMSNMRFQVSVMVCNDILCRRSIDVPLSELQ